MNVVHFYREARLRRKAELATFLVFAVIVAVATIGYFALRPQSNEREPAVHTESEGFTEPLVANPSLAPEVPEFKTVKARGFDDARNAGETARSLMPFTIAYPSYVPNDLRLYYVDSYISDLGGHVELYYTLEPDGTDRPALRINWTKGADSSEVEPRLNPAERRGSSRAGDYDWQYFVQHWPSFDTLPGFDTLLARTFTPAGILISVELRLIAIDESTGTQELQKVLVSLK